MQIKTFIIPGRFVIWRTIEGLIRFSDRHNNSNKDYT